MQVDEERRTRILLYGYSSEEDESSDGGDTYSPIPDNQSDRSESISTASNHMSTKISESSSKQARASSYTLPSTLLPILHIPERVIPEPLSPDFLAIQTESITPAADTEAELDCTELETPIEVATPVLYCIPSSRPSMISIRTSSSQINVKPPHRPVSLPHPPPIPRRSDRRGSAMSLRSATSGVELPTISLTSTARNVADTSPRPEKPLCRRRPVAKSVNNESTLPFQGPSYDVFPRRPNLVSPRKEAQLIVGEQQDQIFPPVVSTLAVTTRRTSSFPADREYSESTLSASPPQLQSKRSTSTLTQRRSTIGLALRNASFPFRNRAIDSRPETSSSAESMESNGAININAFPMPPSSPLFRQSLQQDLKTSVASGGISRMGRVRATIGL